MGIQVNKQWGWNLIRLFERGEFATAKPAAILMRLYAGHKQTLAAAGGAFLVKHAPMWILPVVSANLINFASNKGQHGMSYLTLNLAVLFGMLLLNVPFHVLFVRYMSLAVRSVEAGLRSTLARKLQSLSMAYHSDLQAGRMQSKVLRDVEAIEFLSRQFMVSLFPAVLNMAVAIGITLYHSLTMALFFFVTIPFSVLLIAKFRKRIRETNREFRTEIESMSGRVSEMVEMIPVTRAHGLSKLEIKKVDTVLAGIQRKGLRLDTTEAFFGSSNWVIFQSFQAFCLVFSVWMAYHGRMQIGDVVMYQGFFTMIITAVQGILNVYPQMMKGFESIHSVTEVLMSKDTEEYRGKKRTEGIRGAVAFRNVHFRYRGSDQHVLHGLDLSVGEGESVALVGESGSGKSTVLNLLIGFYKPTEGQVLIDGEALDELDAQWYRRSLAVVLQNNILFSGTIRDNIAYGMPSVSEEKLQQVIDMANLRDVIDGLPDGLDTKIGEHGGKLSGGQRQRIAIARAFVRDPKILILDEATSALDNKSEFHVQQAMQRLMKGRTTVIVAHRLSTVRNVDRIVVMKKGRCVEMGTYEELVGVKGEFYQLRQLQA